MSRRAAASLPPGYLRATAGGAEVVAIEVLLPVLVDILGRGTLFDHAAAHPARRSLVGRAPVYVIPLRGTPCPVVVRHSWHGGALARITGDRFLAPTRAPMELATSLQLESLGVPTPRVVAYVVYGAGPLMRRSDVVTEEIPESADLAAVLSQRENAARRGDAIRAASELLAAMARTGVRHPDLNLKNLLIARRPNTSVQAFLLDVDRVTIVTSRARAAAANAARLVRSARKWRDHHGAPITAEELEALEAAALGGGA